MRSGSGRLRALAPALPAAGFVAAAFLWPAGRLWLRAFAPVEGGRGVVRVLAEPPYRRALLGSLGLSVLVASLAVALCLPAAIAIGRGRFFGRGLLGALFAVPLSLSGVVIGFIAVAMLGNVGALPRLFHLPALAGTAYGATGLVVAYLYFEVPRAILTMEAALGAVDDGLLEAARTLGARPIEVARRVFLPLCAPAMRSAFGVTFAASLGSFGVALILAARFPILSVELYRALTGTLDDALAAGMAVWLAVAALLALTLTARGVQRASRGR